MEESETDGEEEEDQEIEVIIATPLRFPWPALSTTIHLTPIGIHGISGFGQLRQLVVMMPTLFAI